ncbi:hypothetical protein FDECE_15786 [Fusarium decemcellulare]|nr:hypothetical protein FDECE_15786 [Fusarium decemcellulare]
MSIVALSDGTDSKITELDLRKLASQLNVSRLDSQDAKDYLTLLRSFESVMKSIENAPDYTPPELLPQSTTEPRNFWRPQPDGNPFNAWSYRCDIISGSPTRDLLAGYTVAIKDNISVGGLPTTLGIPLSLFPDANFYPISPIDAIVVSRILAAGGMIKGTSTCESFCASPLSFTSATGPVHNPLLHGYTTGGSSSGSAALVAANRLASTGGGSWGQTVDLAIGSDQAGSVRIPASYNGIYGLKPTFGLVPYTGAASMSPMIDHIGPLAATLEGVAALLEVMAGYDGYDPRMTPETPLKHQVKPYLAMLKELRQNICTVFRPGEKLKVGLLKEAFYMPGVAEEVRNTVYRETRRCFEAVDASVIEVSIPMHQQGPAIWTAATRPSMSSYLCQGNPSGHLSYSSPHTQLKWPPSQETYDTLTLNNPAVVNIMLSERFARSQAATGLVAKAHRKVFELRAAYDHALESVDVLVTPCAPTVAMPHPPEGGQAPILDRLGVAVGLTSNTCPFNVTGHPGLSVPCGFSTGKDQNEVPLPIGMQIVGRRWADEKVLEAAALFERGREIVEA